LKFFAPHGRPTLTDVNGIWHARRRGLKVSLNWPHFALLR